MSGSWHSPYLTYIYSIRTKLGIFSAPTLPVIWKQMSNSHFLTSLNNSIVHLPWLQPLDSFQRLPYVCESKWSSVISEFRLGVEGLGNKNPRSGYNRKPFCPVCPLLQPNSGIHLLYVRIIVYCNNSAVVCR